MILDLVVRALRNFERRSTGCWYTSRSVEVSSAAKIIFVQPKVDFLSHKVTAQGIAADPTKQVKLHECPFSASKTGMKMCLGAINYYRRFIQNIAVCGPVLYQFKEDDSLSEANLVGARASLLCCNNKSSKLWFFVILTQKPTFM